MYDHSGLQDILYMMLYSGAALYALIACIYILLRRSNAFSDSIDPPANLRRWAAAFLASIVLSHIWWPLLGTVVLRDNMLVRTILALMLDRLTFVPFMAILLLRMLQDRKRPVWPVAVVLAPLVVIATLGIIHKDFDSELYIEYYTRICGILFVLYYVFALWQYNRWLRDNYADLQHKEVWKSFILISLVTGVFIAYTSRSGGMTPEYVAQINTFIIVSFVICRVETLQTLDPGLQEEAVDELSPKGSRIDIGLLLEQYCESSGLYLQHDITLSQLAQAIGTNRTYLSQYFAQKGITYNSYINSLRIKHFIALFPKADAGNRASLQELAWQSGYRSYSTFSANFRAMCGINVSTWVRTAANK